MAHFNYRGEAAPGLKKTARLHVGLPLGELLADAGSKAILEKRIGAYLNHPMIEAALDMSLEQIAPFAADVLTPELLQTINDDLAQV